MTLQESIHHWKTIGEWEHIKCWFPQADTYDRYYRIVQYIREHRGNYGRYYRDKILAEQDFIDKFGYLAPINLDDACKCMNRKRDKLSCFHVFEKQ